MYAIEGKVILVTGGAAGIGAGIVCALLEEKAKNVIALDVDVKAGKALEIECAKKYGPNKLKFLKCDITTPELDAAYDLVIKEFGYIDTVINNAGIFNDARNVFEKEINVNMTALVKSSLKAYDLMRKDKGGRGGSVINISSIVGLYPASVLPVYCATKTAVIVFTRGFGSEPHYDRAQVRFVTACFGVTDTTLLSRDKLSAYDKEMNDILVERIFMLPVQRVESAVSGLIEVYKKADTASTWLITSDTPPQNVTKNVDKAFEIMGTGVLAQGQFEAKKN